MLDLGFWQSQKLGWSTAGVLLKSAIKGADVAESTSERNIGDLRIAVFQHRCCMLDTDCVDIGDKINSNQFFKYL